MSWLSRLNPFRRKEVPESDPVRYASDIQRMIPEIKKLRLADLTPASEQSKPVWTDWNYETAATEGYRANVWAFICIWRIATSIAMPPWHVERYDGDENWTRLDKHPLASLIERPNYLESRRLYMQRLALHILLGGNGVQSKVRVDGIPVELWNIRPDIIKPVKTKSKRTIEGYEVTVDGSVLKTEPVKNIIHQQIPDPLEALWGMPPTQPGGRSIDIDREGSDWIKKSLENRAVASGVMTYKYPLSDTQFEQARERLAGQIQGSDNALGVLILGWDAEWNQMSMSPVEMDFIHGKKMSREEICATYGVPPPCVGIMEDATLANQEGAWVAFWLNTVIPFLDDVRDTWNLSLTPEFGRDIRLNYDLTKVPALQALFRANIDAAKELWRMGIPIKEINRRLGLGFMPFDGWDVSFIQDRYVARDPKGLIIDPYAPRNAPEQGNGKDPDEEISVVMPNRA